MTAQLGILLVSTAFLWRGRQFAIVAAPIAMATQAASPQSVSNTGDHNIIVQAHGDGINITVGLPYLALVPWSSRVRSRELGLEPDEELLLPYRTLIEALIAEIKLRPEEGDPE